MKKIFPLVILFFFFQSQVNAQCEIVATAIPTDITCGTCVELSAFGEGQGNSVFTESFNTGAPVGWQSTASATYTNPCSPGGVNGTTHLWMGDATGVPRQMTTNGFDFSTATAGATICFDMLFAEQGDASPCEGPDEPDEGVSIQYSIDNGATWIEIHYFDPNGGNDASLVNWNNWCYAVPPAALTANTQFRWFQDNDSGAEFDHWGLDNVNIYFNDPTYEIVWQHDNYSYGVGNGGGANPTLVCPQVTTTYTVNMTNGTSSCTDQVTINVVPPVFRVSATPDTTLCAGQCVDLSGEATIVVSPAKTPTYENNEVSVLTGLPSASDLASLLIPCVNFSGCNCPDGSSVPFLGTCPTVFTADLTMNINITDLNTTSLQNGELTSICLSSVLMTTGDLTPFELLLTCPSGNTITLANVGDLSGTSLTDACFDLTATNLISTGSAPYTGAWQPVQPLSSLNACTANGVWTLTLSGTFDLSSGNLPIGFLDGWEISFDDPEIIYEGDYVWSPTTSMTNSNSLTPTVCPILPTTYVLTVTDSAGCASEMASVFVDVTTANCCPFEISYTTVNPNCGIADGSIDITITNGSGNYSYSWDNGLPAIQDASSIGGGSYTITVTDNTLNCQKDTLITLVAPNSPTIDSVQLTQTTCGLNNGSAVVFASGGVTPYLYSLDGGTSTQSSSTFSSLSPGSYIATVIGANSCSSSFPFTINPSSNPVIDSTQLVNTSCGNNNGSIIIFANNGQAPLQYSIDNGGSFVSTSTFSNLTANTYDIVVQDANLCSVSSQVIINPSSNPVIDSTQLINTSCGNDNGSIIIFASDGQSPLQYSIDNGGSFVSTSTFPNLAANTYDIIVQDANLCSVSSQVIINPSSNPVIDSTQLVNTSCGNDNGSIIIFASNGLAPLQYSIDNGGSFVSTSTFSNLAANTYNIVVQDANLCSVSSQVIINPSSNPVIDSTQLVNTSCGNNNGSILIFASNGQAPLQYSIDNGGSFVGTSTFTNLAANTYNIVVQDANLCSVSSQVIINPSSNPVIDSTQTTNPSCGVSDGIISIFSTGGQLPLSYSIDNGTTTQASNIFTNLAFGNYSILVLDANNCSVTQNLPLNSANAPIIDTIISTDPSCIGFIGSITITATGGIAPLQYSIDNGVTFQASNSFTSLPAGTYDIIVQDALSCSSNDQIVLQIPLGPTIDSTTVTPTNCGGSDGTIVVNVTGGSAPISYSIDNGTTTQASNIFTNLSADNYTFLVTDNDGCSSMQTATVTNIDGPSFTAINLTASTCGDSNGNIEVIVSGGTAPYEYSNDNGVSFQSSNVFPALVSGTYSIIVQEQGNPICAIDSTVQIGAGSLLVIDAISSTDETCFDFEDGSISLAISGGTAPYVISYNGMVGTNTESNLNSGAYNIQITDADNCVITDSVFINPGILVQVNTINDTSVLSGTLIALTTQASGGTNTSYEWAPAFGLSCISCPAPNATITEAIQYEVIYTDTATNCSATANVNFNLIPNDAFCLFPDAFSPNADVINDGFGAICEDLKYIELKIYNRWGELIYQASDDNDLLRWDGRYENKNAPLDVYTYVANIEFLNGKVETLSGNFTLIR